MTNYTPDEWELRGAYLIVAGSPGIPENMEVASEAFTRAIARIKAEAWDEGYREGVFDGGINEWDTSSNPYREASDD